jgi:hypothetical protein
MKIRATRGEGAIDRKAPPGEVEERVQEVPHRGEVRAAFALFL